MSEDLVKAADNQIHLTTLKTLRMAIAIVVICVGVLVYYFEGREADLGAINELKIFMEQNTQEIKAYIDAKVDGLELQIDGVNQKVNSMALEMSDVSHTIELHSNSPHIDSRDKTQEIDSTINAIQARQSMLEYTMSELERSVGRNP